MANFGYEINRDELPQSDSNFDPIPAGSYDANIMGAELKQTKDGTGDLLKLRYDITGPSHSGRVVFGNINLKNKSPKAEEIGRGQLRELMTAVGVSKLTDTDQLIGLRCQIKVKVRPAQDGYEAQNEVQGWKASGAQMSAAPSPSQSSGTSGTQRAAGAPPWAK